jgi:hypothetical protein
MSATSLGRLEKVDLREVWQSEANGFTPWLAREENLKLLGDTIGIELECEAQETSVGPFRADILCKDTASDDWVLIENQLEPTDHTHLGQLLTYAAGLEAATIVWVAEIFTAEHRATLDWLNGITDDQFSFFGLEIELWRIKGCPQVAPKFNIVSQPNDWTRTIKRIEPGELTEIKRLQLEYWSAFRDFLATRKSFLKPQKPSPQHWLSFSIGRFNFHLAALVNTRDDRISCGLYMDGPHAKEHFKLLRLQESDIQSEIGETLEWRELPDKKQSNILLSRPDTDPENRNEWQQQHTWLAEKLEAFHKTFSQRVKNIHVDEDEAPETDSEDAEGA